MPLVSPVLVKLFDVLVPTAVAPSAPAGGAAVDAVAGGTRAGGPGQADRGVAGACDQAGGRRLRGASGAVGIRAVLGGTGARGRSVQRDDLVVVGGTASHRRVGVGRRGDGGQRGGAFPARGRAAVDLVAGRVFLVGPLQADLTGSTA